MTYLRNLTRETSGQAAFYRPGIRDSNVAPAGLFQLSQQWRVPTKLSQVNYFLSPSNNSLTAQLKALTVAATAVIKELQLTITRHMLLRLNPLIHIRLSLPLASTTQDLRLVLSPLGTQMSPKIV